METLLIREFKNQYGLLDKWTYRGNVLIRTEFTFPKVDNKQIIKKMTKKEEVFEQINELYRMFADAHNGTTKSSQTKARKYIGDLKKLVTEYRKCSVEESKK